MNIDSIIKGCVDGNPKSQKALFDQFASKIFSLCRRYSQDDHSAKDLVQECFIQIFKKIELYKKNIGPFEAWVFVVSKNRVFEILRKQKIQFVELKEIQIDQLKEDPEILSFLSKEEIIKKIQGLPQGYKQVLNMYIFEDLTHKQIGEILGINESSSRSRLTRAKQMLLKDLIKIKHFTNV